MIDKKNASTFFDISNIAEGEVREEKKNASVFFDILTIAEGEVREEEKPEAGSAASEVRLSASPFSARFSGNLCGTPRYGF